MAAYASNLISRVRGFAVDSESSGIATKFTEAEVISAINQAKHDLFGRRPDAFSSAGVVTVEPDDIVSGRTVLEFTYSETTAVLQHLASSLGAANLATGSILVSIRTATAAGTVLYFGDSDTNYIRVYLAASKLVVDVYDSSAADDASLTFDDDFANGSWNDLIIAADGASLTITDDLGNTKTVAYTGDLIPGSAQSYLGFSNIATVETYFGGAISDLVIKNTAGTALAQFDMDDGSGSVLADSVGAYNGTVHHDGGEIDWLTDDTLEVSRWAELPLCWLGSAILMAEKSKDAYFRKASEENMKKYLGSI